MANFTVLTPSDFKRIYIKSDSATTNTDYPVLEIYLNSVLKYTLVVGGSTTIGSTTYTTTSGADNLNFVSTTTTIGTEYVQELNIATLTTSSTLSVLDDGVWEFKLLDASAATNIFTGIVIHDDIDCAISSKLDKICSNKSICSLEEVIELTNKVRGLIYSANISAKFGEFKNAECKYNIANTLVDSGCNCGCS